MNEWTNLAWPARHSDAKTAARMEEIRKLFHADKKANVPPRV